MLVAVTLMVSERAEAGSFKPRPFQDLVNASDLILVGTVTAMDEAAGVPLGDPMTSITVNVEQVLRGTGTAAGETYSIFVRGGLRSDGLSESWTLVPELVAGDRYVLFLRSSFYVSPFVSAEDSVLRVVRSGDQEVVVDRNGYALRGSEALGLLRGSKVADSLVERRQKLDNLRRAADSRPMVANSALRPGEKSERAAANAEVAANAQTVLSLIRNVSKTRPRPPGRIVSGNRPLALPRIAAPIAPMNTSGDRKPERDLSNPQSSVPAEEQRP